MEPAGAGDLLGGPQGLQGLMPPQGGGGVPSGGDDLAALLGGGSGGADGMDLGALMGPAAGAGAPAPDMGAAAGGEVIGPPVDDVGGGDFEEMAIQELTAALQDPATPPEERAMIEQQLAEAARRRLGAGAGGGLAI